VVKEPPRVFVEAISGYPPCAAGHAATRDLLDHDRTRYKTHAWGLSHWPVLPRPQLAGFHVSTEGQASRGFTTGTQRLILGFVLAPMLGLLVFVISLCIFVGIGAQTGSPSRHLECLVGGTAVYGCARRPIVITKIGAS
jgi:hypothetical protein